MPAPVVRLQLSIILIRAGMKLLICAAALEAGPVPRLALQGNGTFRYARQDTRSKIRSMHGVGYRIGYRIYAIPCHKRTQLALPQLALR